MLRLAGAPAAVGLDTEVLVEQVVGRTGWEASTPNGAASGRRPKFPRPTLVELCLRRARRGGPDAAHARHMGLRTLDAMAAGGIYDHLVGGFCRYSTDARWLVPHFEKMLTDQAQLARAYLHAWQDGGRAEYLVVVTETLDFVLRDLSTPEGASVLLLRRRRRRGRGRARDIHVRGAAPDPARCTSSGRPPSGTGSRRAATGRGAPFRCALSGRSLVRPPDVEEARLLLAAARAQRVQPARDEKVLTEWNAMTVATLAEVAAATDRDDYGRRAEEIGEFLWASMYADGRLMRSWQGGRARHLAVAADYAWLAEASFRLSEWTGKALWRERAVRAVHQLLDLFWDDASGGFFTHRQRRRGARRPAEGVPRRRRAGGQLRRRRRAAARQRLGGRAEDRRGDWSAPSTWPDPSWSATREHSPTWWRRCPCGAGATRSSSRAIGPTCSPRCGGTGSPTAVTVWGEPDGGPLFEGRPPEPGLAYVCQGRTCQVPAADAATLAGQLEPLIV